MENTLLSKHFAQRMTPKCQEAYERIKAELLTGRLKPGNRLKAENIAEEAMLSVTPVREALIHLSAEHYVTAIPKQGFFVSDISEERLEPTLRFLTRLLVGLQCATPVAWSDPEQAAPGHITVQGFEQALRDSVSAVENSELDRVLSNLIERTHMIRTVWLSRDIGQRHARAVLAALEGNDVSFRQRRLQQYFDAQFSAIADILLELAMKSMTQGAVQPRV